MLKCVLAEFRYACEGIKLQLVNDFASADYKNWPGSDWNIFSSCLIGSLLEVL